MQSESCAYAELISERRSTGPTGAPRRHVSDLRLPLMGSVGRQEQYERQVARREWSGRGG
jgi:hypothetical protein